MRLLVVLFLAVAMVGAVGVVSAYRADLDNASGATAAYATRTVESSHGPVTFAERGSGVPLLSIHGTGGGFDQGLAIAQPLAQRGYRVIAPSRFGYLATPVPTDSRAPAQADAFADLLDALDVERAVIVGTSAGAITALHFAERYPERTLALVLLVPAHYPVTGDAAKPWSPLQERLFTAALRSDFLFWLGLRLAPLTLGEAILATDREILAGLEGDERVRVEAILWDILPISARADGLVLDAMHTADPVPVDLGKITSPTFLLSAEDDLYETAPSARGIAEAIPGAELMMLEEGGHVWAGRQDEVMERIAGFLEVAVGG